MTSPPDNLDIRIMNDDAPYDVVIDVLDQGELILDKAPDIRTGFIEHISNQYRINQIVLFEFTKEARRGLDI